MSGQPWLKFYPADWRSEPSLRVCSIAARGLWMEMLCLMQEATPCGSLLVNERAVSTKQLAALAGVPLRECEKLVAELEQAGVFSRDSDETIYSRRMRRDVKKAAADKANGKGGGNPKLKGWVNPQVNGVDKAQKPDTRSQIPEESPTSGSIDPAVVASSAPEARTAADADAIFEKRVRAMAAGEPCSDKSIRAILELRSRGCPEDVILAGMEAAKFRADQDQGGFRSFAAYDGWIEREWKQRSPGRTPAASIVDPAKVEEHRARLAAIMSSKRISA